MMVVSVDNFQVEESHTYHLISAGTDSSTSSFVARISTISGLGPVATQSLLSFARDPRNVAVVDGLIQQLPALAGGRKWIKTPVVVTAPANNIKVVEDAIRIDKANNVKEKADDSSEDAPSSALSLAGRHVVFTGTMKSMNRKKAQEIVEAMGEMIVCFE